jgi:hypothetical protein
MYNFKLTATGANKVVNKVTESTLVLDAANDEVNDILGKAIYSMECAGYNLNTHNVFTEASKALEETKLNDKFRKVYTYMGDDAVLTLSVKVTA